MSTRLVLALAVALVVAGCGGAAKPKLPADQYYKEASDAFADENYEVAATRYKDLLDQYPFSEHAEEAELRIAHSHYQRKQYAEAIAAFNDFQRMHPMSPHLPEVYYLLGKSYMDQMTTIDRDQGASENAHGWFRVVIDRYPESKYAALARVEMRACRYSLAEHERYIAAYYLKRDNLRAGENRVKGILENYPDTLAATQALESLAVAYAKAGDVEHEQMARAALVERANATQATPPPDSATLLALSDTDPQVAGDAAPRHDGGFFTSRLRAVGHFFSFGRSAKPVFDAPTVGATGPATAALLADLTDRYGAGQGVSTAATAPSLLDPERPRTGTRGDPRYGPAPGTEPSSY
jgi:outer membrane protein assembly factor BamD